MTSQFFPEIDITKSQAEAIARGLYAVAKADGTVHDREAALIADFYSASTSDQQWDLTALERSPAIEGPMLALALPSTELRQVFVKSAILLAYADGGYGAAEGALIVSFAKHLGVDDLAVHALELEVKDFLMSSLAHVSNTDALIQVGREMKLGD